MPLLLFLDLQVLVLSIDSPLWNTTASFPLLQVSSGEHFLSKSLGQESWSQEFVSRAQTKIVDTGSPINLSVRMNFGVCSFASWFNKDLFSVDSLWHTATVQLLTLSLVVTDRI